MLVYVDPIARERFVERMRHLDGTWISNESAAALASTDSLALDGRAVLTVDGTPVARTHPHGRTIGRL
ncbi:hypothetical protein [Cellulosimicrobium sp. NPDC057127]|uniref:hypothetical protein n=1 Tax=Cellulosimicrobium sp. NPDC057127 TaxID=3346026 RepID=UPI0036259296